MNYTCELKQSWDFNNICYDFIKMKDEPGENSSNSMDVSMDSKASTEGESQETKDSPLPSVTTPAGATAAPSTSQTKQPRQKKGKNSV